MKVYQNPLKTGALAGVLAKIARARKPDRAAENPELPCLRRWLIGGLAFSARTRSEARALAKKRFGWPRVPAGTVIEEVRPLGGEAVA